MESLEYLIEVIRSSILFSNVHKLNCWFDKVVDLKLKKDTRIIKELVHVQRRLSHLKREPGPEDRQRRE